MVTIFGASSCAGCKQLKTLAAAKNIDFEYRLIDEDVEAYQDFVEVMGRGRANMPVCVAKSEEGGLKITEGMNAGVALITELQELN